MNGRAFVAAPKVRSGRRGRRLVVLLACAALTMAGWAPGRATAVNLVEVRNNYFAPDEIHIAKGETVTWIARDGGHTVTADDERFSFPESGSSLASGQMVSWTFDEDETFIYRCKIHAPGMSGVVVVGLGSPPPPPPEEGPHLVVPSPEYPTIAQALTASTRGSVIELLPGVYRYEVGVAAPDVTIRGMGLSPGDVVVDGEHRRAFGFHIGADGVTIENVTVRNHGLAGILFAGVERFTAERVQALDNGFYGIAAQRSRRGVIHDSTAVGSGGAGISVEDCDECDVDVDGVTTRRNAVGVLVTNAGSVTVGRSEIRENGAGVLLRTLVSAETRIPTGTHVWGNTIVDNADPDAPRSAEAVGTGVWIAGGSHDVIEGNVVSGHRYGIVVAALDIPSVADRVRANTIGRSSLADLAWDGIGADVCFGENLRPDDSEPSSDPPFAQTIYSCGLPHTLGIPWPVVTARMFGP